MKLEVKIITLVAGCFFFFACAGAPKSGALSKETVSAPEAEAKAEAKAETETRSSSAGEISTADAVAMEFMDKETASPERIPASPTAAKSFSTGAAAKAVPTESGLKAGYSDDNEQFNYFVKFLEQYTGEVESYPLKIAERIILTVNDSGGKPVVNADVTVQIDGRTVASGRTFASGIFHLFPLEYPEAASYKVLVAYGGERKSVSIERRGPRSIEVKLNGKRKTISAIPLDIAFILDTTGSMGEEIERLRSTIEIINANVSAVTPKPLVRFALVLYRDVDDAYLTSVVPFTADLDSFQKELNVIAADGGGDSPEDLQAALSDALKKLKWNTDGIRLAFTITDAEPHLDYGQTFTYAEAARDAKTKGIKLFTVGTGGLPLQGEYIMRQISQYTSARYIFLTYGEKGESDGGAEASVSHHTGSNFQTDKLETIIIRFTREELAFLNDVPLIPDDPYFDAKKIGSEEKEATLSTLFQDSLQNLADYSTYSVGAKTNAVLMPLGLSDADNAGGLPRQAEYFSEALLLSALKSKPFVIVERKDLQKLLDEQKLQYSGLVEDATAVKLGAFLGAEVMVTGRLYLKDDKYEIFLKLLRVETGEILSVSKAKLTKDLGL